MYLGLFLAPWMAMYAISTLAMSHHQTLSKILGERPTYERESEKVLTDRLNASEPPQMVARKILIALGFDGRFTVEKSPTGESLVIARNDPLSPRRITYTLSTGNVLVERQIWHAPAFLGSMHRRRGYQSSFIADDLWAISVDLTIVAMVFWVASGFWMWWEMKATRKWGALAALGGVGLFVMFLILI